MKQAYKKPVIKSDEVFEKEAIGCAKGAAGCRGSSATRGDS